MKSWWWAIIVCAAVTAAVIPAAIMATDKKSAAALKTSGTGPGTPSAPPPIVFSIVWTVLFLLAGGMLAYQGLAAKSSVDWAAFALLAVAVILCWAWSAVFAASPKGATFLILGILLLTAIGVVTWGASPAAQKGILCLPWIPLLVWLVFALMLSVQQVTVATSATKPPPSS